MALVDLKSNLANFRSEFITPSVESQAVKRLDQPSAIKTTFLATDSRLDVDIIPDSFNGRTKFTKPFVDRSIFNRDDNLILKYTGRTRFTLKYVNAFSKFNVDDNPEKFINIGFSKLSLPRFINRSQFNIDTNPDKFSNVGFSKLSLPRFINRSIFNIDTTPSKFSISGVSKLSNKKIVNASQFNIDSVLDKYENVGFRRLSVPRFINRSLLNVDNVPTKHGNDFTKSNYKGITGTSFNFPTILTAVFRTNSVELKNSKFGSRGVATIGNQLGAGSLFHYTISGAKNNKIFSSKGYADNLKYGDVVKGGRGFQGTTSLLYRKATEQNSPSAVDEQYKKFNLRDEAFNYSYINHPLILRGIQRKGKEEPNRWGIDGVVNFDSGLIRGGITAATERAANDLVRLTKWTASPKGLLWVVKQVGLGLSNPKVESIGGPLTRQTRIHTGVASLLSVPTTGFGLHFTRHGIPFANETASYENVSKEKNKPETYNIPDPSGILVPGNRLVALKNEYATGESIKNKVKEVLTKIKIFKTKSFGSNILFSVGGPQSVYGIGFTPIRRVTDTITDAVENAKKQNYTQIYDSGYGYNPDLNNNYSVFKSLSVTLGNKNVDLNLVNKAGIKVNSFKKFTNYYDKLAHIANKPDRQSLDSKAKQESKLLYNPKQNTSIEAPNGDEQTNTLITNHNPETITYYSDASRANTGKTFDTVNSKAEGRSIDARGNDADPFALKSIYTKAANNSNSSTISTPNSDVRKPNPFNRNRKRPDDRGDDGEHKLHELRSARPIESYATMAYSKIRNRAKNRAAGENTKFPNDFRNEINESFPFIGKQADNYYKDFNLETRYGFGKSGADSTVPARGKGSFIVPGNQFSGQPADVWKLVKSPKFTTGDKINGIDIHGAPGQFINEDKIYSEAGAKDFVKFYFADGEMQGDALKRVMAFRATITGLTDTFNPGWSPVQIMGRPDSAYQYTSFGREVAFTFTAYASNRSEMIPMWRKLNYLASFTAPDFVNNYIAGPFMRLTIGNLYYNCPGFISSLSYTVPDDAVWDIADDFDLGANPDPKQLPTMIEVSVGYTVIGTYRPLNMGRMYALSVKDSDKAGEGGQWLGNANSVKEPNSIQPNNSTVSSNNSQGSTGNTANNTLESNNNLAANQQNTRGTVASNNTRGSVPSF